jgi:hypothetical protein
MRLPAVSKRQLRRAVALLIGVLAGAALVWLIATQV